MDNQVGRYQLQRVLGEGAWGKVLLARDRESGRQVAIKVLAAREPDPDTLARFRREARSTARLQHPHVVGIVDADVDGDGRPFIAYEYVPGHDLEHFLKSGRTPAPGTLRGWAAAIAEALAAAHGIGILHRDLKPANILLRDGKVPLLADFGLARAEGEATLTRTGQMPGTPAFMAPELWRGALPSEHSDQFSWAATFFETVYRKRVFSAKSLSELHLLVRKGWVAQFPEPRRDEDPVLRSVLERSLQDRPEDRFATMAEAAVALRSEEVPPPPSPAAVRGGAGTAPGASSQGGSDAVPGHGFETLATATSPVPGHGLVTGGGGTPAGAARASTPGGSTGVQRAFGDGWPWRRALGAAATVAAMVLGFSMNRTTPTPPVVTPPEASAPGAEIQRQEARGRVKDLFDRVLATHRLPEGGLAGSDRAHLEDLQKDLLDPKSPLELQRLLAAVVAWVALLPPEELEERSGSFLARIRLRVLEHVLDDYDELEEMADDAAGQRLLGGGSGADDELLRRVRQRRAELDSMAGEVLVELRRVQPVPPLELFLLECTLARQAHPAGVETRLDELLGRLGQHPRDPEALESLYAAQVMLVGSLRKRQGLTPVVRKALGATLTSLESGGPPISPRVRYQLWETTLRGLASTLAEDAGLRDAEVLSLLDRTLERAAALLEDPASPPRMRRVLEKVHRDLRSERLPTTDPLRARAERLAALAAPPPSREP